MEFETVIGLEVHVQLKTRSKLFCSCAAGFGGEPNTRICPVCTGQPGVLPVLNQEALHRAILAGLALHCRIPSLTKFDRKNYFYPDLPKGYQVSQFDLPVAEDGYLEVRLPESGRKRMRILRAHLEEDAGKDLHPEGSDVSLVDLNRAGVPLLEIVSAPEIGSPQEAYEYLTELKRILQYIRVSDCDMEKGSLRCDANISLRPAGSPDLGVKAEVKNLNSFRNVEKALAFEARRQGGLLRAGESVKQETRMWREESACTDAMRSKEEAHDYRYFPEPDLPPFEIPAPLVERLKATLPELPLAKRERFEREFGLSGYDAGLLVQDREVAEFFEKSAALCSAPKEVSNWIQSTVMKEMNERGVKLGDLDIDPGHVAALIELIRDGKLSHQAGKRVFTVLIDEEGELDDIVKRLGLEQVSEPSVLEEIVREVMERSASMVEEYRGGKEATLNALIGQVMKASKGKANPGMVRDLLIKKIKG
jgi:aspartyl-tRNA(Asn)/glutamyl-tRNA(Gln) amidotransferase subunit B